MGLIYEWQKDVPWDHSELRMDATICFQNPPTPLQQERCDCWRAVCPMQLLPSDVSRAVHFLTAEPVDVLWRPSELMELLTVWDMLKVEEAKKRSKEAASFKVFSFLVKAFKGSTGGGKSMHAP